MICKFRNNGQTCVCANRIYVHEDIYEAFTAKLAERMKMLKVGDGLKQHTTAGPLINNAALKKVEEHITDAVDKGAKIELGGQQHEMGGNFFNPTLITGVTDHMKIADEETFGPVAPIFKFSSEEDVIKRANNTVFGLAAYLYSKDLSRVTRVSEALEYGIVGVNTGLISTEVAPFGGIKQSGLGREGSHHGIDEYMELKYICTSI